MKKLIITLIIVSTIFTSMTLVSDLYTKKQIDNLIQEIVSSCKYNSDLNLVDLSYANIGCQDLWGVHRNGNQQSIEYNRGWKYKIMSNPNLAYTTLDVYGNYIIRQINSHLGYEASKTEKQFDKNSFWKEQLNTIDRYQRLINKLLTLPDSELNYFISTNTSQASSYEFNKYLADKHLINSEKGGNSIEFWTYPGDLLQLTTRTYRDYPEWNPRKFLTEVQKFSDKVEMQIKESNNL